MVCAKLVMGPLGRGFPRPAPIGIPAPKAHVDPLLAIRFPNVSTSGPMADIVLLQRHPYASFLQAVSDSTHFDSGVFAAGLRIGWEGHVMTEVRQLKFSCQLVHSVP
jgi:hypothetical protein